MKLSLNATRNNSIRWQILPLVMDYFKISVGFSGLTEGATAIVEGEFMAKYGDLDLLPETKQLIAEMAMPEVFKSDPKNRVSVKIEHQDFVDGFKKWKERTSTSPSGRHLGHYKAIIKDTEDCEKSSRKDGGVQLHPVDILGDLVTMKSMPPRYGFAPSRWCKSIMCVIEKDPGSPKNERLCIIHLFEVNYNFVLKLIWG